ncbi:MAG: LysR family transcriptional regulator [Candidatus Altiarchaeota archaeon]|nr:LysR family transcriptional regulator [Candidatus Altiarchaeota archaeon]
MEARSKVWIEKEGKPVFGDGRAVLLETIDRLGSINKAAKEMNMSYRHAWGEIRLMEERLGIKLVETKTGGRRGGGSKLTGEGKNFLGNYHKFRDGINELVNKRFEKIFLVSK